YQLQKHLNVNVKVPLLSGHGTHISDLDSITFEILLNDIEKEIKKSLQQKKRIVLGGVCLGGIIALYFASRYPIEGIFTSVAPFDLRYPIVHHFLLPVFIFKKYWKKNKTAAEVEL